MASQTPKKAGFPKAKIEKLLASWWDEQLSVSILKPKTPEECRQHGGTVFDIQPELSSLQAVPVLLELKDVLGFEPSKKVIRRGGYPDRDTFIREMSANCQAEFVQQYGGSQQPAADAATTKETAHA